MPGDGAGAEGPGTDGGRRVGTGPGGGGAGLGGGVGVTVYGRLRLGGG